MKLITDPVATETYIDNALIPMLQALKPFGTTFAISILEYIGDLISWIFVCNLLIKYVSRGEGSVRVDFLIYFSFISMFFFIQQQTEYYYLII